MRGCVRCDALARSDEKHVAGNDLLRGDVLFDPVANDDRGLRERLREREDRPLRADLHRLWRTPVQRSDGLRFFAAKAAGGMRLEGMARGVLSSVRYRGQAR